MAKREWFRRQKDSTQRHRNIITYILVILGALGGVVGLGLLPDTVSINPDIPEMAARPKEAMVALHLAIIGVFAFLFWRRPREWAYLLGSIFGVVMLYLMLFANLGV